MAMIEDERQDEEPADPAPAAGDDVAKVEAVRDARYRTAKEKVAYMTREELERYLLGDEPDE
jgi:hypothetical protein